MTPAESVRVIGSKRSVIEVARTISRDVSRCQGMALSKNATQAAALASELMRSVSAAALPASTRVV